MQQAQPAQPQMQPTQPRPQYSYASIFGTQPQPQQAQPAQPQQSGKKLPPWFARLSNRNV